MQVLLTGGNKGIGKAIFDALLSQDYEIALVGRHFNAEVKSLNNVEPFKCDLSDLDSVTRLCSNLKNRKIDILINNAGFGTPVKFENLSLEQINYEINLNFIAPTLLIQSVLDHMVKNHFGRIINISSISAKLGTPLLETYSSSKAALDSITQSLSQYLLSTGVTINSICPGGIETEMACAGRTSLSILSSLEDSLYEEQMIKQLGIGRLILPEEVAKIVMFLINRDVSYITGQCLNICGALELR